MELNTELLEYLMNSDFTERTKEETLKGYLLSFRYFYRYKTGEIERLSNKLGHYESEISNLKSKLDLSSKKEKEAINNLNVILNRKLTFKERILGKTII